MPNTIPDILTSEQIQQLFEYLEPNPLFTDEGQNVVPQEGPVGSGNIQPVGFIADGAITGDTFDPDPPAVPTGLALSSDVVSNSDGTSFVRLRATLTQPGDSDLYGSFVEVTHQNDGAETPSPVWDRPQQVFIPVGSTSGLVENVRGNTQYWGRARAVDVVGNYSAFTSTVTHTTVGDTTPPPTPQPATVTAGFKGFAASWTGGDAEDLSYYKIRWVQAASPPDGDDGAWTYSQVMATKTFVTDLTADLLYWFEVAGVDLSGNQSGWSTGVSVTPNLIGSTDIAANTITAAMIQAGALDADKIGTGTLRISPQAGFAEGIIILDSGGIEIGRWDEEGIKIREGGTANYILLDAGQLSFTTDNGTTFVAAITPEGINASAITFGTAEGGHNLLLNSSFELTAFVANPSSTVFTDNSGTPGWKAANRTTAPVNTTEGAADLQITAMAY